ncbi:MAG TPA: DUF4349 domain-containing protein [Acidimicrobiia bacterium]
MTRLAVSVPLLLLLAAACSSGSGETSGETFLEIGDALNGGREASATTTAPAASADEEGALALAEDSDERGTGGTGQVALLQQPDLGRDIIFTADLTVAVTDVTGAGEEAIREIQSLGGFLFGQHTTGSPQPTSVLTFKVQPDDFQEALRRLGAIGEIRTQNVSADDVTERIVDLESRINTAAASVDRLRALLAQATDIKTIVELERELLARETELEVLRGSLRTLQDQVALATIVLTLTEAASRPELEVEASAYPAHDGGLSCPGAGELTVEEDTEATVCLEITNVGDTWLADFEVRDPVLNVELDDMIVVFGDPTKPIEPGESVLLALEILPSRDLRTRTTVTATPVDEEGEAIPGRPASSTVSLFIDAVDPSGIPTFREGLETSWDLLLQLGQLIVLFAGALIPFVWVPLLVWFGWRLWRTRAGAARDHKDAKTLSTTDAS